MACIPFVIGITLSDISYLLMAIFGLATIAEHWSGLFTLIRFVGAAYLLYLGWKMWTVKVERALELERETDVSTPTYQSYLSGIAEGFLISASNPKVILFYIAFLPTFMDLTQLDRMDIMTVCALSGIALISGFMFIAVSTASMRHHFRSVGAMTILNRVAGGIMMSAGLFLALRR